MYAAKAAISGAWYNWFGIWGNRGTMPNFSSLSAVYPRLKLIRAVPNWDNLNNVPLESRNWDGNAYRSTKDGKPQSYISSDVMYSRHWKTGKLFAVFNTVNGSIALGENETVTDVQSVDGYFIEAGDASADFEITGNKIEIKDGVTIDKDSSGNSIGKGYIFTVTTSTPDTTAPTISITLPTAEDTYATSSSTLNFSGTASDETAGSGLKEVTWSSSQGGSGTATLTDSTWSLSNITLVSGTNTITVTATDNAGNSSADSLTVTYTLPQTGTIAFSGASYSRSESYTSATITVTRTGGSDGAASIQYSTTDGSATSGQDYTSTSGSLNWVDGVSANRTFTIPIISDTIDEPNETVNLTLTNATGASLGTLASAVLTINDNDNPPTVAFTSTSQSKAENQGTATITLQLSSESAREITLPFNLSGTATGEGTDYSITPSPLTIPVGQTSADISVTLTNDTTYESQDETVIITLGTPTNTTRGSPSSHTLTIADDDPIPDTTAPTVSISSPTSETTYSTTSSTLSLSGSASDDTTLYSVTWSSDKGGSGTATLTEKTWTISNISLTQGDNLITVTASDSSANSSSDSLTVTYTPITAPTVTTLAASSITQDSVALNGSVNPNSGSTTVWFGYGTASGSYPNTTPTQALSGSTSQEVSASLSSLSSNTTYYYRLASQNSAGTSYGTEISFTTSAAGDTTAPTVTITTPKPDSNKKYSLTYAPFINIHRVNNDTIDISGKASDNVNITSMSWYDDQGNIGPIITSDNYLHWLAKTVPINSGSHSLTIEAKDNSGNVGKDTLAINYEKAPVSQTWQHVPIRTAAQKTAGLLGGESFQWVFGMSYAPANPYVIYFINDVSKVWKSSDGGNTWHPKGGNGFRAHAGNSLAVDPKDENIVFVTGSVQGGQDISGPYDGIYRTKDGGENWELVKQVTYLRTNSRNGTEIVFSGNNIYAGTTKDGLFKSTDGGDAWSSLNLFVGQKVLDLKSHPAQEGVLFVSIDDPSGTTNDGLYKVTESAGAASAAKIGFGLQTYPNEIAISNNDPLRVYAAVRKYGVYKSTDGGENFVPANTGMDAALTAGREAKQIGISPVIGGDDYLWVSYSYGFIYYSHNNGANWKEPVSYDEKNSDGWVDGSIKGGISAGKGPFSSSPFAPHPFDKNIVMAIGASNAPKKSEDGGLIFVIPAKGMRPQTREDKALPGCRMTPIK